MQPPALEARRTILTTGLYDRDRSRLESLASLHPFSQQLDVIFPSSEALENALQSLHSKYWTCRCALTTFIEYAKPFVNPYDMKSNIIALGMPGLESDDVWSLDTRGVLTLAVCKETYQSLGLVGQKLPWKGCDDTYVIQIFLHSECPDSATKEKWHPLGVKQKASLEAWDARRGSWKIMYNYTDSDGKPMEDAIIDVRETKPIVRKTMNAHIPVPTAQPLMKGVEDVEHEEWEEKVSALFEWVGMACLGAKRLQVMDRPDPYVAVYSPPSPSRIGEFTHVRWSGLLPPGFVQSVINAASSTPLPPSSFVCITSQGVPTSPVSYLSPHRLIKTPLRAPRAESEDTWSLLFSNGGQNSQTEDNLWWALVENIGQWDMRWG